MKNTYKIFTLLAMIMLIFSCEKDGGDSNQDLEYGAVIDIQKTTSTDAYINLTAVENGESINLGFTIDNAVGEITSMDVVAFYTKTDGTVLKGKLATGIKTLPYSLNFSQTDLFKAIDGLNT